MQQTVRRGIFLLLVLFVTVAFVLLINDFLLACFWAVVLAVIFHNTFRRIRIRLRGRNNLSAALTTLLILLVVVIPTLLIATALVNESLHLYQRIEGGEIKISDAVTFVEDRLPEAERFLSQFGFNVDQFKQRISQAALTVTETIANQALSYTQNAITFTIQFFLMLYLLFFFLRDGQMLVRKLIDTVPIGNRRERMLLNRFASVARATLKGTLIVALVQGTIGGVLFWAVGIEGALLWGVVMTLFSLLPVGGSGLVWGPAAIIFLIQGQIAKAIIIVAVGALLIGLIDNLLRPILVGRDTQMPDYLVLLATLGGLAWFGLSGFIIGPVIAALFISCWEIMSNEYGGTAA